MSFSQIDAENLDLTSVIDKNSFSKTGKTKILYLNIEVRKTQQLSIES